MPNLGINIGGINMETVKIKCVGKYKTHSIRANKNVDVVFDCNYDELVNYIQLSQLLNENVDIAIKIEKNKPFKLGMFMVKEIKINSDGSGILRFNSQLDYVEANNLNILSGELLQILFKADIEIEDESDDDEE